MSLCSRMITTQEITVPLVHIYTNEGKTTQHIQQISDGIHKALMQAWNIPQHDRFHIIHEKKPNHLMIDKIMWDVDRSNDVLVLNIVSAPRTREMKLSFYEILPKILKDKAHIRPEDIFVSIINNNPEDWSFGNGEAQLHNLKILNQC